jgi:hypothetical protein
MFPLEPLAELGLIWGAVKRRAFVNMSDFVPRRIPIPYHFDIEHDRHGHWTARERGGLTGGTFVTCKDALRFALFEAGGDGAHVHLLPERRASRSRRASAANPG